MKQLLKNKPLAAGLGLLALGQLLYFAGFTMLFVLALIYVLAIGVPYPRMLRSLVSRLIAGSLLAISATQLMAVVQFFVFPSSDFRILSLLVFLAIVGTVWLLRKRLPKEPLVLWQRKDAAAALAVLFFVVPLVVLCFWKNNPVHLTQFAGTQSPDGVSHEIAIAEMDGAQHLNYRTVQYYPKGFHLASAFFLRGVHANQRDLSWLGNARVYVGMYAVWGAILIYLLFYLSRQLLDSLAAKLRHLPNALVACTLGPIVAVLYALPFLYNGFINYYYICAAVVLGVLYLYEYTPQAKQEGCWFMLAYLLLVFGVSMSWGPLLTPALLLIPVLYLIPGTESVKATIRRLTRRENWVIIAAFVVQLAPLYLHFKYAKLNSAQGINAQGIIRDMHFGLLLAGIGLVLWLVLRSKVTDVLRRFAINVLLPMYLLVGLLIALQYFAVGELRYYSIKTAYLLELFIVAVLVAAVVYAALQRGLPSLHRWLLVPIVLGTGLLLALGMSGANPLLPVRQVFRQLDNFGTPAFYQTDVQSYTTLGVAGKLTGANNEALHYDTSANKIFGNGLIGNWANAMQHTTSGTPEGAACSSTAFTTLTYGTGQPSEQSTIINAVNKCIALSAAHHQAYYIITDPQSAVYLRQIFGTEPTYVY